MTTTTKAKTKRNKYGHRVVYVSIPENVYTVLLSQCRNNCRTLGQELLYTWRKSQTNEV